MDREVRQIFCVLAALKDAGEDGLAYGAIRRRAEEVSLSVFRDELPKATHGTTLMNEFLRDAHSDKEIAPIRDSNGSGIGYKIQERGVRSLNYITNTVVNPYLQKEQDASTAIGVTTVPARKNTPQTLGL